MTIEEANAITRGAWFGTLPAWFDRERLRRARLIMSGQASPSPKDTRRVVIIQSAINNLSTQAA